MVPVMLDIRPAISRSRSDARPWSKLAKSGPAPVSSMEVFLISEARDSRMVAALRKISRFLLGGRERHAGRAVVADWIAVSISLVEAEEKLWMWDPVLGE